MRAGCGVVFRSEKRVGGMFWDLGTLVWVRGNGGRAALKGGA